MLVLAFMKRNNVLTALIFMVAVVLSLSLSVVIPVAGIRPYGEQAILEQIDHEDSALCAKFEFALRTSQFADCMIALADLRQRHVDLLTSYSWL
jgi:hypothetical protein